MMTLLSLLRNVPGAGLMRRLVEVCYPGICAACGRFDETSDPLCGECERRLGALEVAGACERCGRPLPAPGPCPWCLGKGIYPYQRVLRLAIYEEPVRSLVHMMKYKRRWAVAEMLAERLLRREQVGQALAEAECIVAVPLFYRRQIERGYNQAEMIARRLARKRGLKVARPASRTRDTQSQTQLHSRKGRLENVRGAFALKRGAAITGKRVVVVDDVMTSGATLREIGRTLLGAKPASLSAIVVAVADPKGRDFRTL